MLADVVGNDTGVRIETSSRREPDDQPNGFSSVEILLCEGRHRLS
jgi:hypothetical protein